MGACLTLRIKANAVLAGPSPPPRLTSLPTVSKVELFTFSLPNSLSTVSRCTMDVTEVTTGVLGNTERLQDRSSILSTLTSRLKAPANTSPP